jgi:hypothetical protein
VSPRITAIAIAVLTFIGLFYFTPRSNSPAVTTRMGLTLSIVQDGVLTIDRFAPFTEDKASFEGHYFADKAPGLSLLGVPPAAAADAYFRANGLPTDTSDWGIYDRYARVATLAIVGVLSSLTAAMIYLIALRLGASAQGAVFGSFVIAIGSPFFFWSVTFMAHAPAGALFLVVFGLAVLPRKRDFRLGVAIGVLAGLAVVIDLTAAIVLGAAGLLLLALTWRPSVPGAWGYLAGILLGGLLGVMPLFIYNTMAFGSPFHVGYASVVGFDGMKEGLFGISWPKLSTLYEILFGTFRGLRQFVPVLVLVPIGLALMWLSPASRTASIIITAIAAAVILINGGYHYWEGGWSAGPRHLISMLPVLGVAMAFVWSKQWWWQVVCIGLMIPGLVIAGLVPTVTVFTPSNWMNPLEELYFPAFRDNVLQMEHMLYVWAGFGWLLWQAGRAPKAAPAATTVPESTPA